MPVFRLDPVIPDLLMAHCACWQAGDDSAAARAAAARRKELLTGLSERQRGLVISMLHTLSELCV